MDLEEYKYNSTYLISQFKQVYKTNINIFRPLENDFKYEGKPALKMKNVCAKWDDASESVLKDVNLDVPKGEFVALTGPVGSGKVFICCFSSCQFGKTKKVIHVLAREKVVQDFSTL